VFNLSAKEESLATEIISLIKGIFGVKATTRLVNKNKTGRVVEVNNVNVVKVFKKIAPGLADSKRVPALFMISDEQVKMGLVSGWLDGDGHKKIISVAGKPAVHISGVTISHDLARDMMVLCLSSGMASAGHMRPAYQNHKLAYTVGVSGKQALKVFPELKCQAVNKGINLYNTDINRTDFGYARRIKSIDVNEVVDLPVYDFEVEEDHSFLAKDIAVHNCVANRGMCEFIEMLKLAQ
jgi:hypothetical protein